MGFINLRQWMEQLRKDKELAVVEVPVDPYLELPEIHRRVLREEGPALLFTNVKGTPFPVVTNLFGTFRRVDRAFGSRPEQLLKSVAGAAETLLPPSLPNMWKEKALVYNLLKTGIKHVPQGKRRFLASAAQRLRLKSCRVSPAGRKRAALILRCRLCIQRAWLSRRSTVSAYTGSASSTTAQPKLTGKETRERACFSRRPLPSVKPFRSLPLWADRLR